MIKRLRPVLLLLGVAVLAYGLLIPQMGFYWDELPMSWIRYELGPAAMTRYFSTNRPVWGLLYQVTTRLLPQVPVYWQIFALLWRFLTAVLIWAIVREMWQGQARLAVTASLLFLLYPGFNQQWTSYLYSHFFIVLCFLLLSWWFMLRSFRSPGRSRTAWSLTLGAILLSALNLWMMEYFFVLELLRPFLILHFVATQETPTHRLAQLRRTMTLWAPYLAVYLANILWRLFVFNNQIYHPTLISKIRTAPLAASWELVKTVLVDLYQVSAAAWAKAFSLPNPATDGPRTILYYAAVVLGTALLVGYLLVWKGEPDSSTRQGKFWLIALGLIGMVLAGGPFWLTGLEISLAFPANRFTLPFMFGVSLLLAGLLAYLPERLRSVLVVALVALAAGRQALWADAFRRDWTTQKAMFWQLYWRAPGIQPGTMLLVNQGPLQFYADNSLSAALNWIYDPTNRSGSMDYALFYPTSRTAGTLPELIPGQTVSYDFISEVFHGSTDQTLAFYYSPPGCLRLLDPGIDANNRLLSDASMMREAATLSSSKWIEATGSARMPEIYGPEPVHGWCYYFEQADLAAQMGNWSRVAQLGDTAFQAGDYPNDPVDRFVFIEGYAQVGNWTRAEELAMQSYKVSPRFVGPLLCKLIGRMNQELPPANRNESSLNDFRTKFSCLP